MSIYLSSILVFQVSTLLFGGLVFPIYSRLALNSLQLFCIIFPSSRIIGFISWYIAVNVSEDQDITTQCIVQNLT